MDHRVSLLWKLNFLLICLVAFAACQPRAERNPEPSASAPPKPASASPTLSESVLSTAQSPKETVALLQFHAGRNDYELNVDSTPRKFIVHVPGGYDPARPTPVVFVFHGSNQNGSLMYKNTAWVDQAEKENILLVFPSSWEYFITRENRVEEKWNDVRLVELAQPGAELKNDVHFVQVILEQLRATFNLDEKRIYATGGSNGGGFVVSRLAVQMNDVFAAYSTCGAILLGDIDTSMMAITINASLYNVFGSLDEKIAELNGLTLPFPFQADEIINDPNFSKMLLTTTTILGLEMDYTVKSEGDFTTFTFDKSAVGADNEYIFRMVRGMGHVYPSGDNNRAGLNASDLFWGFFMQHVKP